MAQNVAPPVMPYRPSQGPGVHGPSGQYVVSGCGGNAGSGGRRRGPNARVRAAGHPIKLGAPIRLTRNTSASLSTPRISPISVGRKNTTMSTINSNIQNTGLFANTCIQLVLLASPRSPSLGGGRPVLAAGSRRLSGSASILQPPVDETSLISYLSTD